MKVAYISVYRDKSGYAHAAEDFIQCLDSVGIDVTPIWVTLTQQPQDTTPVIEQLEKKDLNNVDIIIQQTLPQYFCKIPNIPCIGSFFWETDSFRGSNWQYPCNMMDEIWVTTPEQVLACKDSNVTCKVREVNAPHDISKFDKEYKPLNLDKVNDRYIFYNISEISYRKNITGLIATYYSSFSARDNVALVIKGFVDSTTAKQTQKRFQSMISELHKEVKKKSYPPVVLISDFISDQDIMRLHAAGDCFVTLSRGEGECIPLFDAAMMGNITIAPNWNGPAKTLANSKHFLIRDIIRKPVIGMGLSLPFLYNGDEHWYEPSLYEAQQLMKKCYQDSLTDNSYKKDAIQAKGPIGERFSYKTVGPELKKALEEVISVSN